MQTDRREEILGAYERLVGRFGVDKTTMNDVAEEAGVSVGTLYNEFRDREDLIRSAVDRLQQRVIGSLPSAARPGVSAAEELREVLLGHVRAVGEAARRYRSLLELSLGLARVKYVRNRVLSNRLQVKARLAQRVAEALERGSASGEFSPVDVPATADRLVDAMAEYWFPPLILERDPDEVVRDAEQMVTLLTRALRP